MKVEYDSNNSGGKWWLTDDNWKALEAAGWKVDWIVRSASRDGLSLRDAVAEWERVTGQSATDPGCPCCGQPHTFTEYDADGKWVADGPMARYTCEW